MSVPTAWYNLHRFQPRNLCDSGPSDASPGRNQKCVRLGLGCWSNLGTFAGDFCKCIKCRLSRNSRKGSQLAADVCLIPTSMTSYGRTCRKSAKKWFAFVFDTAQHSMLCYSDCKTSVLQLGKHVRLQPLSGCHIADKPPAWDLESNAYVDEHLELKPVAKILFKR